MYFIINTIHFHGEDLSHHATFRTALQSSSARHVETLVQPVCIVGSAFFSQVNAELISQIFTKKTKDAEPSDGQIHRIPCHWN
jgi:hypothetical protein